MPKTFSKLTKAYFFLSKHPKFEVEFPTDGSKPSPKLPNSIKKSSIPDSRTFVRVPTQRDCPAGRDVSKHVDAINLIVNKVTEKTESIQGNSLSLQGMWLKIKSAIEVTSSYMKSNVKNQIMANAQSPMRKPNFDILYHSIAAEAKTQAVKSENCKKVADLKIRGLELKEWSVQLSESLFNATSDPQSEEEEKFNNEVV